MARPTRDKAGSPRMTPFRFSLQRVLDWRRAQLEREQIAFEREASALAELDRALAELEVSGIRTELQVRAWSPIAGADLAALGRFRASIQKKEEAIGALRADRRKKLASQQAAVLEARRRFRLLERLKERREAEWRRAAEREIENVASESFLARWKRRADNGGHDA
jgi:flagellar biosynthesis chaperone FliJ